MNRQAILGQECICPDGLGRVVGFPSAYTFEVETYVNNNKRHWARENVVLVPILSLSAKDNQKLIAAVEELCLDVRILIDSINY